MQRVRVSAIILTYNRADLILAAIESVLAQTYSDYEIIVIDDGSTDNTVQVLRELIETSKIRYIWQENQGECAARNHGLRQAQGEYIAFLDSDDLWLPQKLEAQVACLETHPEAGLVQSSFLKFDDATGNNLGIRNTGWFSGWIYPQILMHWSDLMAVDAVLIPRKVLQHVGEFDETLKRGLDLELWWRISRYYPFMAMPEVLTKVRVHSGSVSGADKATVSEWFRLSLEKAFTADPSLSKWFRRRALARMYSYMGYNQLGDTPQNQLRSIWRDCRSAIVSWPFEWNAYICMFVSLFPYAFRKMLHRWWKRIRHKDWHS
jgi:glycosyltransferase involved in cell wall biosynthesis